MRVRDRLIDAAVAVWLTACALPTALQLQVLRCYTARQQRRTAQAHAAARWEAIALRLRAIANTIGNQDTTDDWRALRADIADVLKAAEITACSQHDAYGPAHDGYRCWLCGDRVG